MDLSDMLGPAGTGAKRRSVADLTNAEAQEEYISLWKQRLTPGAWEALGVSDADRVKLVHDMLENHVDEWRKMFELGTRMLNAVHRSSPGRERQLVQELTSHGLSADERERRAQERAGLVAGEAGEVGADELSEVVQGEVKTKISILRNMCERLGCWDPYQIREHGIARPATDNEANSYYRERERATRPGSAATVHSGGTGGNLHMRPVAIQYCGQVFLAGVVAVNRIFDTFSLDGSAAGRSGGAQEKRLRIQKRREDRLAELVKRFSLEGTFDAEQLETDSARRSLLAKDHKRLVAYWEHRIRQYREMAPALDSLHNGILGYQHDEQLLALEGRKMLQDIQHFYRENWDALPEGARMNYQFFMTSQIEHDAKTESLSGAVLVMEYRMLGLVDRESVLRPYQDDLNFLKTLPDEDPVREAFELNPVEVERVLCATLPAGRQVTYQDVARVMNMAAFDRARAVRNASRISGMRCILEISDKEPYATVLLEGAESLKGDCFGESVPMDRIRKDFLPAKKVGRNKGGKPYAVVMQRDLQARMRWYQALLRQGMQRDAVISFPSKGEADAGDVVPQGAKRVPRICLAYSMPAFESLVERIKVADARIASLLKAATANDVLLDGRLELKPEHARWTTDEALVWRELGDGSRFESEFGMRLVEFQRRLKDIAPRELDGTKGDTQAERFFHAQLRLMLEYGLVPLEKQSQAKSDTGKSELVLHRDLEHLHRLVRLHIPVDTIGTNTDVNWQEMQARVKQMLDHPLIEFIPPVTSWRVRKRAGSDLLDRRFLGTEDRNLLVAAHQVWEQCEQGGLFSDFTVTRISAQLEALGLAPVTNFEELGERLEQLGELSFRIIERESSEGGKIVQREYRAVSDDLITLLPQREELSREWSAYEVDSLVDCLQKLSQDYRNIPVGEERSGPEWIEKFRCVWEQGGSGAAPSFVSDVDAMSSTRLHRSSVELIRRKWSGSV